MTGLFVVVYAIDYGLLFAHFGAPYLNAPVVSLSFMKNAFFNVSIGGFIVIRLVLALVYCYAVLAIALAVSVVREKMQIQR